MKVPSLRAVWSARYARPFLLLLGLNLVFLPLTFVRSIEERRLSVKAVTLRKVITEQRKAAEEVGNRAKTVNANVSDVKRFYGEILKSRKDDLSSTLQRLVAIATELGIRTPHVTWQPEDVKGANLTKIEITMPVSGTYQQLGSFLQKLERTSDFVIVRQVAMHGRPSDGAADLDIKLEAYFRGEKP
jgi:Tfp pilus assembly protein PilO